MQLKIKNLKNYSELEIEGIPSPIIQEQHKNFTVDDFFEVHNFPNDFAYGLQFKKAFHKLSILNVIRPESLAIELKKQASGVNSSLKICGELKCINTHFIYHEHVDSTEIASLLINLNKHLRNEKIKLNPDTIKTPRDVKKIIECLIEKYMVSRTGHWLITTEIHGKKIYLDICKHDDDTHVVENLNQYLSEYKHIPTKSKHNK